MKKLMMSALAGVVMLSGCASTSTGGNLLTDVGTSIFTQAVDTKCRSELNANNTYKTIAMFLSEDQKTSLENKACGCVSQKAPQSVTANEMAQAVIDPTARPQIVSSAVVKTLNACIGEFASGQL